MASTQIPEQVIRFNDGIQGTIDSPFHQHFDIYSDPNRLIPYRSTEAEQNSTSPASLGANDLRHFQLGKNGLMYALGNDGSGHPQVYQKTDPTTGNWSASASGAGSAAIIYNAFLEWGTTPAFYLFSGTTNVSKWVIGGSFTNTVSTLGTTIVTVAQSVVGADDNLYMFYNNKVVRVSNAGSVTDNVLTNLPSDMRITSACRWGTYLAIGMAYGTSATAAPSGISKVFIWDMVTTTTVSDVIDWGEGALLVLGNIEGRIVGVTNKYLETPSGLTSLSLGQGSMVVRLWAGATPKVEAEIPANQSVTLGRFIRDVVVKDNKMYWVASVPFAASTATESTYHLGIWAFGRKNADQNFALSLDYVEESVDTANYKIVSFGNAGNYWFINHGASGLVHKTDDAANYTNTSIYERVFGNGKVKNQIVGVTVTTDSLPSAGQVVLKYKKDSETAFTTIFTNGTTTAGSFVLGVEYTIVSVGTTDFTLIGATASTIGVTFKATGAGTGTGTANRPLRHSAINIESTGVVLPQYKKIRMRVESTGGAVVTSCSFLREVIPDDLY